MLNIADLGEDSGAQCFYFYGNSDTDKNKNELITKVLVPVLCGDNIKPCVVKASDIDVQKIREGRSSIRDQLFGYRMVGSATHGQLVRSPLIDYVIENPYGCLIINELDKLKYKDESGVEHTAIEDLENCLRTILDQGGLRLVDGPEVDFSHIKIFITTNELDECVENADSFKGVDLSKVKDLTGSRTVVRHDKAFFNEANVHTVKM